MNRIYLGDHSEFQVEADGLGAVLVRLPKHSTEGQGINGGALEPGDQVIMGWKRDRALALSEA